MIKHSIKYKAYSLAGIQIDNPITITIVLPIAEVDIKAAIVRAFSKDFSNRIIEIVEVDGQEVSYWAIPE